VEKIGENKFGGLMSRTSYKSQIFIKFVFPLFQFCCLARQQIKPFVTAKDFSELVAAAKRLNIDVNGKGKSFVPMVANADPKHVEKAVEKIKEVEKELVNVEDTKEEPKIQGVQLRSVFI
jgi:hypothetical protein